jgi:putative transposase
VLLRFTYLAATNTLALLRFLPMSDREKNIEILALRHQPLVLERQVGKPTFTDTDRAILASLLHHLPMHRLRHLLLPVRPDTALRRHRNLLKQRHAATRAKAPRTPAHPALDPHPGPTPGTRECLLRLSSNPRRTRGAGIKVAASTVWEIL